jgi:hypothetical protein
MSHNHKQFQNPSRSTILTSSGCGGASQILYFLVRPGMEFSIMIIASATDCLNLATSVQYFISHKRERNCRAPSTGSGNYALAYLAYSQCIHHLQNALLVIHKWQTRRVANCHCGAISHNMDAVLVIKHFPLIFTTLRLHFPNDIEKVHHFFLSIERVQLWRCLVAI